MYEQAPEGVGFGLGVGGRGVGGIGVALHAARSLLNPLISEFS